MLKSIAAALLILGLAAPSAHALGSAQVRKEVRADAKSYIARHPSSAGYKPSVRVTINGTKATAIIAGRLHGWGGVITNTRFSLLKASFKIVGKDVKQSGGWKELPRPMF